MVRPSNNLDPSSQPWARSVESDVDRLKDDVRILTESNRNSFRDINTTLQRLGGNIQEQVQMVSGISVGNTIPPALNSPTSVLQVPVTPPEWAQHAVVMASYYFEMSTYFGDNAFDLSLSTYLVNSSGAFRRFPEITWNADFSRFEAVADYTQPVDNITQLTDLGATLTILSGTLGNIYGVYINVNYSILYTR